MFRKKKEKACNFKQPASTPRRLNGKKGEGKIFLACYSVDYDKKNTIVECNYDTTALDIMVMAMIKFQKDVDEEVKDASDKDCIKLATFSSKKMK